jgi:hypothetical protein
LCISSILLYCSARFHSLQLKVKGQGASEKFA